MSRLLAYVACLSHRALTHRAVLHTGAGALALVLSHPTDATDVAAVGIVVVGIAVRAWANAWIRKDVELCTRGPYAVVRHPLYLGTFIIFFGLLLAANSALVTAVAVPLMALVYIVTIRREEKHLLEMFGHGYLAYRASVPALLPRTLIPLSPRGHQGMAWRRALYESALLVGLIALFEAKEDMLECFLGVEYAVWWSPIVQHVAALWMAFGQSHHLVALCNTATSWLC